MKKLVFFCTFMAMLFNVHAQTETEVETAVPNCQFELDSQSNICDEEFTHSADQSYLDSFEPVVFNVYFWEFRKTDGSLEAGATQMDFEKESLDVIAALNIFYNKYNVFFKYYGIDTIDDTVLYNLDNTQNNSIFGYITNYPDPSEVITPNSFNFYISASINFGTAPAFNPKVLISRGKFKWQEDANIHEVGHALGLLHTHENYHGLLTGEDCEKVTRDPLDNDYNADIAGDRVTDTAATSPLYQPSQGFNEVDPDDCTYIGNGKDCDDVSEYEIYPDDIHNIMGYNYATCIDRITVGQAIRLREAIQIDCYDKLTPALRTDGFASFYEPYKGEYYFAGGMPLDYQPPLFQPGFTYVFESCHCDCPQPLPYGDIGFIYGGVGLSIAINANETDYSIITHPNHTAINILQLEESQPWRCYDNNNRTPSAGTIIRFNDNVLNTNVTITPQDSTSINNENLINNLQPGLYNVIEQFEDGSTEEQLIIKENN